MGKFSKKRKRAEIEIAAAASLVLSEQPEESAMDVEANIIRPMDSLKPGEFKRLVLKSLDDSIAMYESLKRQGKELPGFVPADISSRLEECRETLEKETDGSYEFCACSLMYLKKYMKYYFFTSNLQDSPYERLLINRVEDGKPALPSVEDDEMEEINFDYYLATKESHQYVILWDKLQVLLEKREWDWNHKLDFANSIAATEKLDLLYGRIVQACIEDVLGSQDDMRTAQQLEYYRYLFKNEAKNITDEEKLWMDAKEKFPLLNQYMFKSITNCVYPSGKKSEENKLLGIMVRIEYIYEEAMKSGFPLPCGEYYKLKQQLALDLAIVKYDSKPPPASLCFLSFRSLSPLLKFPHKSRPRPFTFFPNRGVEGQEDLVERLGFLRRSESGGRFVGGVVDFVIWWSGGEAGGFGGEARGARVCEAGEGQEDLVERLEDLVER